MLYSFAEFRSKEVIDVGNGEKLGYVDDLEFDAQSAAVAAFVIRGRERLFGLLGREQDLMIPFRQIQLIGTDTIPFAQCIRMPDTKHEIFSSDTDILDDYWDKIIHFLSY